MHRAKPRARLTTPGGFSFRADYHYAVEIKKSSPFVNNKVIFVALEVLPAPRDVYSQPALD